MDSTAPLTRPAPSTSNWLLTAVALESPIVINVAPLNQVEVAVPPTILARLFEPPYPIEEFWPELAPVQSLPPLVMIRLSKLLFPPFARDPIRTKAALLTTAPALTPAPSMVNTAPVPTLFAPLPSDPITIGETFPPAPPKIQAEVTAPPPPRTRIELLVPKMLAVPFEEKSWPPLMICSTFPTLAVELGPAMKNPILM